MTLQETETSILARMVPELQAQGYDVFVRPSRIAVPAFLGACRPAALAFRTDKNGPADKNLVIEVVRQSQQPQNKLDALAKLIADHADWELRVVWISPSSTIEGLRVQSAASIAGRIDEAKRLADDGYLGPALLLAWAILEAQARSLETDKVLRPQTTGRLVETLASSGHVTPDEANTLRRIADRRNALAHGELAVDLTHDDIDRVIGILRTLQGFVPA